MDEEERKTFMEIVKIIEENIIEDRLILIELIEISDFHKNAWAMEYSYFDEYKKKIKGLNSGEEKNKCYNNYHFNQQGSVRETIFFYALMYIDHKSADEFCAALGARELAKRTDYQEIFLEYLSVRQMIIYERNKRLLI